jgi:hypothetical protein
LPTLHLRLAATGAAGTTIATHLAGTSYRDAGQCSALQGGGEGPR